MAHTGFTLPLLFYILPYNNLHIILHYFIKLLHYFSFKIPLNFKGIVIKDKLYLLSENRAPIINFRKELVLHRYPLMATFIQKMMLSRSWVTLNSNPLRSPVKKIYLLLRLQIFLTFHYLNKIYFFYKYFT